MWKICVVCGKKYEKNYKYSATQWSFSKFCSYGCGAKDKQNKASQKERQKKQCAFCGEMFIRSCNLSPLQWASRRFCSPKCFGASKRKYKDAKAKDLHFRRKNGALKRGSPEANERISYYTKLAMYRPEVQEKIRQPRGSLTLETRIKLSNAHAGIMPKNMYYGNSNNYGKFANVQRGEYDINGTTIFFRSKWEANYALYLDFLIDHKEIVKWEFEPDTFLFDQVKIGTRSYTPDFKVFLNDGTYVYHEVKGYMDSKSKTKLKRMKKYYPNEKVVLIDSSEYLLLKKQIGSLCKFYK